MLVSFSSMGSKLLPDGALDWGDTFCDYEHVTCGTSVRMLVHRTWDATVFEYVLTNNVDIEAYHEGKLIILEDDQGVDALGDNYIDERPHFFSGNVRDNVERWDESFQTLLKILSHALDNLHLEHRGVADKL